MIKKLILIAILGFVLINPVNADNSLIQYQWGLFATHSIEAKSKLLNVNVNNTTIVAVLDTGISWDHPDLQNVVYNNNGLHGYNLVTYSYGITCGVQYTQNQKCFYNQLSSDEILGPYDVSGHGTAVSSVISAHGNMEGASNAIIMPVKVIPSGNSAYSLAELTSIGIITATNAGARIISMSLGTTENNTDMYVAVEYAWARNVVLVAAAGNENGTDTIYPCLYRHVICVAAISDNFQPWTWSGTVGTNFGPYVSVSAPGERILAANSKYYTNFGFYERDFGWSNWTGTSLATPFVSASAANILSACPELNNVQVRNIIESTFDDIGLDRSKYGHGLVNASAAVDKAYQICGN